MDNEVVIHVRSVNDSAAGFNSARQDAHKTASDIEGELEKGGKRAGKKLSDGITEGTHKSGSGIGAKLGKDVVEGVSGFLPKLTKNFSTEFSAIAAQSTPILATIGVAAAPLIGAALSGAIIGGAGIGGVIGGVMLAARDQRVAKAGIDLGNTINSQLTRDATPFIQPTLNAIGQLQKAFDANDSHIQNIFKNSARYVEPLTQGITGLMSGILRGLDALTSEAGPVIGAIGKGLTQVGSSLGDMMTQISTQSDGAAKALGDVFGAISAIIQVLGPLLSGLTAVYGVLHDIGATESLFATLAGPIGMLADLFHKTQGSAEGASVGIWHAADSTDSASSSMVALYDNLQSTTASMDALAKSAHDLTDQNNDLYGSTTDVASAMASAKKQIGDNGKTLDLNTKKGRENRQALSSVAGALQKNYDAYVKVNGVGPKSAKLADDLRGKFIALAQKAGMAAGDARNLANQLLAIPSSRNTKITAQAAQALEAAREVRRAIAGVQSKTVTLTIARRVTGSSASDSALQSAINKQMAHGGIKGAAAAPISSGFTWVGEQGPELVNLPAGTQVKSHVDSIRAIHEPVFKPKPPPHSTTPIFSSPLGDHPMKGGPSIGHQPGKVHGKPMKNGTPSGGGGSYGGAETIIIHIEVDGRQVALATVDPMRELIRTAYGGSVQRAYGRGNG